MSKVLSAAAVAIAVAACSGRGSSAEAPVAPAPADPVLAAPEPVAAPAVDAAPDAPAIDAAPAAAPRIELTFMGDVMFGGRFEKDWSPQDVPAHDPFAATAALFASDLAMANLETTVMAEIPALDGRLRFVATPDQVALLPKNGLHAVTIANNHIADVDGPGMTETLRHLGELGLTVVGAPRADDPLFRADTVDVKGWKVAFVAATARLNRRKQVGALAVPFAFDEKLPPKLIPVIEAARPDHDLVIVVLHWGTEYADAPSTWQVEAARAFIDAGADVVVGHHPHVVQGIERYRGGVIAYSLGNYVFQNGTEPEKFTGILRVGFERDRRCLDRLVFHPTELLRKPVYHPIPAAGRALTMTARRVIELSAKPPLETAWREEDGQLVGPTACGP